MLIDDALHQVQTIFLDSAPVIYYIERNSEFFARARLFFQRINDGRVKKLKRVQNLKVIVLDEITT